MVSDPIVALFTLIVVPVAVPNRIVVEKRSDPVALPNPSVPMVPLVV